MYFAASVVFRYQEGVQYTPRRFAGLVIFEVRREFTRIIKATPSSVWP